MHAIEEKKSKGVANSKNLNFIEISAEKKDSVYVISIKDTGCGIKKENLEKLFQPFFTTKAAGKGTGFGLAIVAKLTEEMAGEVSAESEGEGLGSCFKLKFKAP
jgi:two-component system, NtrC family, sensor kinase